MENEFDNAFYEYKKSLENLKIVVEKLAKSNQNKLEAVRKLSPFFAELVKRIGK